MSKIKVMGENLANKIAAGEVIERISSIVKELVENSIDAKSTDILVELKDAGKALVRVSDNGIGMDSEDAVNCFLRHATSKIYKDDDLFFINTLGFRGEALASIAAVSEVVLDTYDGKESTKVHIKGGNLLKKEIGTLINGTRISVTNLFYNTPARLKYLKSEPYELALVTSFLEKLALSYPKISFKLTNNDLVIFSTTGSGDLLKAIHEIYGLEVSSKMIEVHGSNDDYDINGYISKPEVLRSNKRELNTIINGRVIRNNDINKMIDEAYHTYKPDGLYPIVVLNIDTDPTLIDVNIHPTKQDIKFSKKAELKEVLVKTIKDALYNSFLVPNAIKSYNVEEVLENSLPTNLFLEEDNLNDYSKNNFVMGDNDKTSSQEAIDFKETTKNAKIKKLELYPVGIAFGTYIIAQNSEGIFLIDQHAAQERVNYEKVLKGLLTNENIDLLVPISIELTKSDYTVIKNNISKLEDMGFKLEEFGINTFKITSHPIWIKEIDAEDTIKKVFDVLLEEHKNFDPVKFNDNVAATIACKASIKGNSRITLDEAKFLLEELVLCDNPYNCPHGRPTIIKFTIYELEKMFKRVM